MRVQDDCSPQRAHGVWRPSYPCSCCPRPCWLMQAAQRRQGALQAPSSSSLMVSVVRPCCVQACTLACTQARHTALCLAWNGVCVDLVPKLAKPHCPVLQCAHADIERGMQARAMHNFHLLADARVGLELKGWVLAACCRAETQTAGTCRAHTCSGSDLLRLG